MAPLQDPRGKTVHARVVDQPGGAAAAAVNRSDNPAIESTSSAGERAARRRRAAELLSSLGVLAAFLVTFAVFAALRPDTFATTENLKAILIQSSPLAIVAFGLTIVLTMREFDLSFAALAGLGGAVAVVAMKEGISPGLAITLALAAGVAAGAVSGVCVAYFGAPSFIATLAMGTVFTGVEFTLTDQKTVFEGISPSYVDIAQGELFGLSYMVYFALAAFVLTYLLLEQAETGRYMHAIGGNPDAAHISGIAVRRLRLVGFVLMGIAAAVAGVLLTAEASSSSPSMGAPLLLPAFAAAFLGSAAFRPGQFNVPGTLLGILFLGVIQNGLTIVDATNAVINLVQGAILLAAILLTRLGARLR